MKLSKRTQSILSKVEVELRSGAFSLGDHAQLTAFCVESPGISYLGLLEQAEKYLPSRLELSEQSCEELLDIFEAWHNLSKGKLSPMAIRLYPEVCIKIKMKEINYDRCWFLPLFSKFLKEFKKSQYLEFQGYEEMCLVPALNIKQYGKANYNLDAGKIDVKDIKEFYLRNKLGSKTIAKDYADLAEVALNNRAMRWSLMKPEELLKEKTEIEASNLFGRELYLKRLKDEYQI